MPGADVLGRRALNRALLRRQLLLQRAAMPALDAVERLVGLQAQATAPPYVGLWTRLEAFEADELADLIAERRVVRLALQRQTIHAVSARDGLALRPLLQPVFDRTLRQLAGRLGDTRTKEVTAAAAALLADEPMTFAELGRRLQVRWPDVEPAVLARVARYALPHVQVPPRGLWGRSGPAAHTTIEAWLGAPVPRDGDLRMLLLRYLAAFGPASARDAQAWCGLTRLSEVAERLRPRLRVFRDEGGRELLDLPDAPRPDPDTPAPVRFIPPWDNVLRGHDDRFRVMSEEHRLALQRPNDVVPGTVLVDGFVAATWEQESTRATATLDITPLRSLGRRDATAVAAEGRRLLGWMAPQVDASARVVRVGPPPVA